MNPYNLTDEQSLLRDQVAAFANKEIRPYVRAWDNGKEFPRSIFSKLAEPGYLGIGFPETAGGSGGGAVEYALLIEQLAQASAGITLGTYVHTALACSAIHHLGSQEQQQKYLPQALSGAKIGCWAYAEPGSGADVTNVAVRARRDRDDWIIDGSKLYITNGSFADFVVLIVRTGEGKGLKGCSLIIVDRQSPGFSSKVMPKLGMHPSETAELHFEACRVPVTNLLGPVDSGFAAAIAVLTLGRIAAAAFATGLAQAALTQATSYVTTRKQFGGPLTQQQFIRFTLADMQVRVEGSRTLTLNAARLAAAGQPHEKEASIAKLFASEAATVNAERSLHLHGAFGYMAEADAQRLYRDCKVLEWGEGTSEVQREIIARNLLTGVQ